MDCWWGVILLCSVELVLGYCCVLEGYLNFCLYLFCVLKIISLEFVGKILGILEVMMLVYFVLVFVLSFGNECGEDVVSFGSSGVCWSFMEFCVVVVGVG